MKGLDMQENADASVLKYCPKCKQKKSISDFHKNNSRQDGIHQYCKPCRKEHDKKYRKQANIRNKKYRNTHKLQIKDRYLKNTYGITIEDYNKMLSEQNNCCAICGYSFDSDNIIINVDHDHETGAVRGLLCDNCNLLLGHSKHNIDILLSSVSYLRNNI